MDHSTATTIHMGAIVQATDPGSTTSRKLWVDTSSGPPYQLKLRKADDSAWETVCIIPGGDTSAIQTSALDTDGTLAADSDAKVASQKAIKTYADAKHTVSAKLTAAAASPNATQNVDGTAVDLNPDTGFSGFVSLSRATLTYAGIAGETVTTTVTATFSDATTASVTDTKAANGSNTLTSANLETLAKTGHYITKLSTKCQSTINSSAATVVLDIFGAETP